MGEVMDTSRSFYFYNDYMDTAYQLASKPEWPAGEESVAMTDSPDSKSRWRLRKADDHYYYIHSLANDDVESRALELNQVNEEGLLVAETSEGSDYQMWSFKLVNEDTQAYNILNKYKGGGAGLGLLNGTKADDAYVTVKGDFNEGYRWHLTTEVENGELCCASLSANSTAASKGDVTTTTIAGKPTTIISAPTKSSTSELSNDSSSGNQTDGSAGKNEASGSSDKNHEAAIIGGAVGGAVGLIILFVLALISRRYFIKRSTGRLASHNHDLGHPPAGFVAPPSIVPPPSRRTGRGRSPWLGNELYGSDARHEMNGDYSSDQIGLIEMDASQYPRSYRTR